MLPHRPILALITNPLPLRTTRMIITPAILRTIRPEPPQIALALILRLTKTLPMMAHVVARTNTRSTPIADIALPTLATKRAVGVGANRLRMAIVQTKTTLVHVWTVVVGPTGVGDAQHVGAVHVRVAEVTLDARPCHRVGCLVAPTAAQRAQAVVAGRVVCAVLATLLRFCWVHVVVLDGDERVGLIEPFPAQTKLILAGIDGETETLLGGFAPNTTALLLQTRTAILSFVARHGALV